MQKLKRETKKKNDDMRKKKSNKLTIEHSDCCRHDIALSSMANCKESKKILKLIYVWA